MHTRLTAGTSLSAQRDGLNDHAALALSGPLRKPQRERADGSGAAASAGFPQLARYVSARGSCSRYLRDKIVGGAVSGGMRTEKSMPWTQA
jgi:hypothetical protein